MKTLVFTEKMCDVYSDSQMIDACFHSVSSDKSSNDKPAYPYPYPANHHKRILDPRKNSIRENDSK